METSPPSSQFSYCLTHGWSQAFPPLDSDQTLVVVFGPAHMLNQPQPFKDLAAAFPNSHILGCSTSGAILGTTVSHDKLAVAVHRFGHTRLRHTRAHIAHPSDSFMAAQTLAQTLLQPDLRGVFVLSDGIGVNGSQLVEGLRAVLPPTVAVCGGLAGDGAQFSQTWIMEKEALSSQQMVAVGFYGDRIQLRSGSQGGWDIFGIERRVTKAKDNVVYEIDRRPALELYKTYLGELAEGLPGTALLFPLGLHRSNGESLVRTILSVNEAEQSLTFAGDVPEGHMVQLMKASPERLIDGASRSAQSAHPPHEAQTPVLSVAISCVGRQMLLKQRLEEEVEAVLEVLPEGVPVVGFYSHGEIASQGHSFCELHNQTMTVTNFYEA